MLRSFFGWRLFLAEAAAAPLARDHLDVFKAIQTIRLNLEPNGSVRASHLEAADAGRRKGITYPPPLNMHADCIKSLCHRS